jgi:ATP-binding protein involved in chromosome partitioning
MKKVGVVSGKGGVGKSTIAVSMALALAKRGYRVGLLDVDLTGANVHDLLGRRELEIRDDKFVPSAERGVRYVSLGQIAANGVPVLWDAKDLKSAARQLLERTDWGDLDFLICDFPPGFGPETLEVLPLMDVLVMVTTPSALSRSKVERMIEAAREYQVPIAGVIVNMDRFACPKCGSEYRIFPDDHSFEELGIPTIARIPLSPEVAEKKVVNEFPVDEVLKAIERPVLLKRRPKSLRRRLLELLLKIGR